MADPVRIRVDVENLSRVTRALKKAGHVDVPVAVKAANLDAAVLVRDDALPHVPVATGALKNSLRALAGVRDARVAAGSASRVRYAAAIHWGVGARTGQRGPHNITGRPYIHDAAARMRDRVEDQYRSAIETILKEFR
jgi:hypothetical protein